MCAICAWPAKIDWPEPGCSSLLLYPASMKANDGSVPFCRSIKNCESGAMWLGSMQNEFCGSPTAVPEGCVVPVQAAPLFLYRYFVEYENTVKSVAGYLFGLAGLQSPSLSAR